VRALLHPDWHPERRERAEKWSKEFNALPYTFTDETGAAAARAAKRAASKGKRKNNGGVHAS
jgi:hypothetical protein